MAGTVRQIGSDIENAAGGGTGILGVSRGLQGLASENEIEIAYDHAGVGAGVLDLVFGQDECAYRHGD